MLTNPPPPTGAWLESYDPSAANGRGVVAWTTDAAKAARFPSPQAAFRAWRSSPRCHPTRPDGKPNRPLTAYTVAIEPLPAAAAAAPGDGADHG
jgi:hypothetical protein